MNFLEFDDSRDFPYYDNNPRLSKKAWITLLLSVIVGILLDAIGALYSETFGSILFCFSMLIPLLYFSKWDYSLIFHKPSRNEIKLAVLLFAGYIIYAMIVGDYIDFIGMGGEAVGDLEVTLDTLASLIFGIMGEELLKFIPLMFLLRLFYKLTNNRKISLILSSIPILIGFGLLHYTPDTTLTSVLLIQGLGTVFELYGYFKTKNIIVPYLSHLLTDAFIFGLWFIGIFI